MINDDFGITFKLHSFVINIKKKVCDVLELFLYFLRKYEKKKSCNMLDLELKNLCLIFLFIGREEGVNIVEKYDRQSLYPMLLKFYHYLHSKAKSKVGCAYQIRHAKSDLNIFEQSPSTNEPTIELVIKEMLIFRHYQVGFQRHQAPFSMVVGKT